MVTSPGSVASTFNGLTYTKNSTEIYNVEDISSNWVNGFTDETVSTTFTFAFQASGSEYKRNNLASLETLMDWEQDISMNILPTDVSYNDFRSQFDISFNGGGSGKEFTWSDLTSDGYGVTFGKLRINWTGGQLEPTTGISMVAVKYTKHSTMTRVHLVNSNGGEADDFTTFQEISYPPEITSKSITNAYPKRINFTTSSPISVFPDKNDFTFSNMTPNPDGTMASFANDWTIGADVSSNENLPTTSFYYEGGSEWQYNASGELAYTGDVLYDFDDIAITNNVETPFFAYPGPGGANQSWINKDEPNSVYMGFRFDNGIMRNSLKEGNWAPDATYDVDRINKTKNFKFVTTNIDDGLDKINIIDVSRVSIVSGVFVDTTSNPTTYEDISMVKFDLSRNSNDISNVDNPYSFTSRDNIHMWWDYSGFSDKAYRFSDSSGNEIFDSSANVKFINTNYNGNLGNDMSGNVANTTSSNLTGRWDGTPPNHFGALKIVNLIQDISMVSTLTGVEENESSEEILKIVFQNDVSFNSPIMTSINTDDWQVDISGAGTSQLWETLPDVSKNTISVFDEDSAHNTLLMTFDPTTGVFHHGDEIKITLKPMNDKPLSRQYIDISGNKLIPYNISNDGNGTLVTNTLS